MFCAAPALAAAYWPQAVAKRQVGICVCYGQLLHCHQHWLAVLACLVVPRCGDPRVPATMDAETMMPLFIFLLSRSSLQRPHACLAYLANFALSRTK